MYGYLIFKIISRHPQLKFAPRPVGNRWVYETKWSPYICIGTSTNYYGLSMHGV